jgi:hypothetical protein
MIPELNIIAAWIGILLGVVSGIVVGLRFADADWLGGYASWPRRMIRLGHISFFGIALLNVAFYVTCLLVYADSWILPRGIAGWALLVAAAAMPTVCFLAAWRKPMRQLFFVPVLGVTAAGGTVLVNVIDVLRRSSG